MAGTILRPHFFMHNLLGSAASVATDGMLFMNLGAGRLSMIDSRDIGEMGPASSSTPTCSPGKVYTPSSPEAITMEQAAAELSRALCKQVNDFATPHR